MAKAQDAFRTISEVSEALDTPAHVLRFWESKFSQVKPVKRAGGRRYYRPDDMALLSGIKKLLHDQGMTIKGAQKLIREKGIKHVVALGQDALGLWSDDTTMIDAPIIEEVKPAEPKPAKPAPEQKAAIQPKRELAPEPQGSQDETPAVTALPPPAKVPGLTFAAAPPPVADFTAPIQRTDAPARFFDSFAKADPDRLRSRVAKIAPLVAQLETIHAKMVHR